MSLPTPTVPVPPWLRVTYSSYLVLFRRRYFEANTYCAEYVDEPRNPGLDLIQTCLGAWPGACDSLCSVLSCCALDTS